MSEIFSDERAFAPSENVETTLYDGFFSPADKNNMAILRTLKPEELAHHGLKFADPRVEQLLFHYRARHYPETLTRAEQVKWQKYCNQQIDAKAEQFAQSIETLSQTYHDDPEKLQWLEQLMAYAEEISEAKPVYAQRETTQPHLMDDLNKVAEQTMSKEEKLKQLKALIK